MTQSRTERASLDCSQYTITTAIINAKRAFFGTEQHSTSACSTRFPGAKYHMPAFRPSTKKADGADPHLVCGFCSCPRQQQHPHHLAVPTGGGIVQRGGTCGVLCLHAMTRKMPKGWPGHKLCS